MAYNIRNRFASIRHNDAGDDDPRRVMLERTVRDGRVVWVPSETPEIIVADGRNATEADAGLCAVYAGAEWDFRFVGRGIHSMRVG